MRKLLISGSLLVGLIGLICLPLITASQTWTPRPNSSLGGSTGGYYEYLPAGYDPAKRYPIIIFVHGAGEVGNGNNQLSLLLTNDIPKMINEGRFPSSVSSGGSNYSFIVIAPQFYYNPSPGDMDALITNIGNRYSVDPNRIYLTGLSMGGGAIWDYVGASTAYASRPAAVVPICGSSWADGQRTSNIVSANLPVLATHNDRDPAVSVYTTIGYVDGINALAPTVPAIKLIFSGDWHNAWDQTYATYEKLINNMNFFEWLLSNQRNLVLPVGLLDFDAVKETMGINLKWSTSRETNSGYFTVERSEDGRTFSAVGKVQAAGASTTERRYSFLDKNLPTATSVYYRLRQTDQDGRDELFKTLKVLLAATGASYKLFPTIANSSVTLELEAERNSPAVVKLVDMNGKQLALYTVPARQQRISLDVSSLVRGVYFLQIKMGDKTGVEKFVKQ